MIIIPILQVSRLRLEQERIGHNGGQDHTYYQRDTITAAVAAGVEGLQIILLSRGRNSLRSQTDPGENPYFLVVTLYTAFLINLGFEIIAPKSDFCENYEKTYDRLGTKQVVHMRLCPCL